MQVTSDPPATPLEFHVELEVPDELALDQVVYCERAVQNRGRVTHCGVVEDVSIGEVYLARVRVVRIQPEIMVAPGPGAEVKIADPIRQAFILQFDEMKRKFPIGLLPDGIPAYANVDFITGAKGAHLNIGGISGIATKTSYALFLLHSLFHSPGGEKFRAIAFNVKGDDLLYLRKPNSELDDESRQAYAKLGLPDEPFRNVANHGVQKGLWTLHQFARLELIRYLFSDTQESGAIEFAVNRLAEGLREEASKSQGPGLQLDGRPLATLPELVNFFAEQAEKTKDPWFENDATGTRKAVMRRLKAGARHVEKLITPDGQFDYEAQMNVVDIHNLSERGRSFVVGSVLATVYKRREALGDQHPTTFIMLDELNKYAPREGDGPIRTMLLDIAERGRSLGIILVGAQQTASQVVDRVVGNSALRVVGRLESAESSHDTYGWLSPTLRRRAAILLPGTMIVSQPQIPVPLTLTFPHPAWATRHSQAQGPLEKARADFAL